MCKKKIKNILVITQLAVLFVFCLFAIGSASSNQVRGSETYDFIRAAAQGAACGGANYKFIGYYNQSDCPTACRNAGYSYYCTGENTTACYCQ